MTSGPCGADPGVDTKSLRKDREFREYLLHSGSAESILKLLLALRDHKQFSGEYFPLPKESVSGVNQILFDYFGSQPDGVWGEIEYLQGNIAVVKDRIAQNEERVLTLELDCKYYLERVSCVRAWRAVSNLGGIEAEDLEEGQTLPEKKQTLTGKEFLTRLLGAYKKLPHADLVEVETISRRHFVEFFLRNYEQNERWVTDARTLLTGEWRNGPFYGNANNPDSPPAQEHQLTQLVKMTQEMNDFIAAETAKAAAA